jgi:hypothetical protein
MKAMTDFVREYGIYDGPSRGGGEAREEQENRSFEEAPPGALKEMRIQPGVCIPWAQKSKETPEMTGDEAMVRRVWEEIDSFAYTYIWHCLVSF